MHMVHIIACASCISQCIYVCHMHRVHPHVRYVITSCQVDDQIQKLDNIKAKLQKDIESKGDSLSLDMQCLSLPSPDELDGPMPEVAQRGAASEG